MSELFLICVCATYSIGNSLTVDSIASDPNWPNAPSHTRGTMRPLDIYMDPNMDATVAYPDKWPTALLDDYDAVTIQPHIWGTIEDDVWTLQQWQAYAPHIQDWYIIAAWPRINWWDATYSATWLKPNEVLSNGETRTWMRRAYFDALMPLVDATLIPTGEVFYELEQAGYDLTQYYRDDVHLNNEKGRPIANKTLRLVVEGEFAGTSEEDAIIHHTVGRSYAQDFLAWQRGEPAAVVVIPEPSTWVIAIVALVLFIWAAFPKLEDNDVDRRRESYFRQISKNSIRRP